MVALQNLRRETIIVHCVCVYVYVRVWNHRWKILSNFSYANKPSVSYPPSPGVPQSAPHANSFRSRLARAIRCVFILRGESDLARDLVLLLAIREKENQKETSLRSKRFSSPPAISLFLSPLPTPSLPPSFSLSLNSSFFPHSSFHREKSVRLRISECFREDIAKLDSSSQLRAVRSMTDECIVGEPHSNDTIEIARASPKAGNTSAGWLRTKRNAKVSFRRIVFRRCPGFDGRRVAGRWICWRWVSTHTPAIRGTPSSSRDRKSVV